MTKRVNRMRMIALAIGGGFGLDGLAIGKIGPGLADWMPKTGEISVDTVGQPLPIAFSSAGWIAWLAEQPTAAASTGWTEAGSWPSNLNTSLPYDRLLRFPQNCAVSEILDFGTTPYSLKRLARMMLTMGWRLRKAV